MSRENLGEMERSLSTILCSSSTFDLYFLWALLYRAMQQYLHFRMSSSNLMGDLGRNRNRSTCYYLYKSISLSKNKRLRFFVKNFESVPITLNPLLTNLFGKICVPSYFLQYLFPKWSGGELQFKDYSIQSRKMDVIEIVDQIQLLVMIPDLAIGY